VKCCNLQSDARLFAINRILLQAILILARLSCEALVFWLAAHTRGWQRARLFGITMCVVTRGGRFRVQRIALHVVLANAMMVLKREEAALVTPRALSNARSQAPMPELTLWAQALFAFLHCGKRLIHHIDVNALRHLWYHNRASLQDLVAPERARPQRGSAHILHNPT